MKFKSLLTALSAAAFLFIGCQPKETPVEEAKLSVSPTTLSFDATAGDKSVQVTSTREWRAVIDDSVKEWLSVSPEKGGAGNGQEVRITVKANSGNERKADVKFTIGLLSTTVAVSQEGELGPQLPGDGSKEHPFSVAEAIAKAEEVGTTPSSASYYIKGFVSEIRELDTGSFGNATFYLTDTKEGGDGRFYCYRTMYLDGAKFTSEDQLKVGDVVVVYSKIVNYMGNTPETSGSSRLISVNGEEGQGGQEEEDDPAKVVYFNNFDKEAAVQTSNKWPFVSATECWKNETGTGASGVSYLVEGNKASIRNNSFSPASGTNNWFFGSDAFFCVKDIALQSTTDYTISFYGIRSVYQAEAGASVFDHGQFKLYISNGGEKWVALEYAFEGGDPDNKWGKASATFTVPSGTQTLCIGIPIPGEASTYRLDDIKLKVSETAGTAVDFSTGIEIPEFGGQGGGEEDDPSKVVYFNNFDKTVVTSNTAVSSSDCWNNETGTGISDIYYLTEGNKSTIRTSSSSTGSGNNNWFFGAESFFCLKDVALQSSTDYTLSFYTIYGTSSAFDHSKFKLYVSDTGEKWVELQYAFDGGDPTNKWGEASVTFSVPSGTESLCIGIPVPGEASKFRLDDLKLKVSETAGTAVDFSKGIVIDDFIEKEVEYGTPEGDGSETSPFNATAAIAKAREVGTTESTEAYYIKGFVSKVIEVNTQYGNATFNITDKKDGGSEEFQCYRIKYLDGLDFTDENKPVVGDEVIVYAKVKTYNDTPETSGTPNLVSINGKTEPDPYFIVTPETATISAAATTVKITVSGNVAWTATSDTYGFTPDKTSGTGKAEITVDCPANTSTEARTVKVTVATASEAVATKSYEVVITQSGVREEGAGIVLNRDAIGIEWTVNGYGKQATGDISTYVSWTVDGVSFLGCKICLPQKGNNYDNVNAIQCQGNKSDAAKQSRFGNTSAIGKIRKITVVSYNTSNYTPSFNLALSTSQVVGTAVPSSMVNAGSMSTTSEEVGGIVKYTTVYNVTGDNTYFAIYKNTDGALYWGEITIETE